MFFFRGSAFQVFRQAECKCNSDEAKQNYFCGRNGFALPRLILFGGISAAQEGAGGMRGGFGFWRGVSGKITLCVPVVPVFFLQHLARCNQILLNNMLVHTL